MHITSYAQNFEDVILWRALGHIEKGFYIDIGAQDPLIDSVSLAFYEHGWNGVHVEPVPRYAELLRQQRPNDIVIQAAIGTGGPLLHFFEIENTGISTASLAIAQQQQQRGFALKEITVPCVTLSSVFELRKSEVHWLKIDVEGYEREVLSSWGETKCRPWIVLLESVLPGTRTQTHKEWEQLILQKEYSFAYFDGLNRFYVANEHLNLMEYFGPGPNVFDNFSLNGTTSASVTEVVKNREIAIAAAARRNLETELEVAKIRGDQLSDLAEEHRKAWESVKTEMETAARSNAQRLLDLESNYLTRISQISEANEQVRAQQMLREQESPEQHLRELHLSASLHQSHILALEAQYMDRERTMNARVEEMNVKYYRLQDESDEQIRILHKQMTELIEKQSIREMHMSSETTRLQEMFASRQERLILDHIDQIQTEAKGHEDTRRRLIAAENNEIELLRRFEFNERAWKHTQQELHSQLVEKSKEIEQLEVIKTRREGELISAADRMQVEFDVRRQEIVKVERARLQVAYEAHQSEKRQLDAIRETATDKLALSLGHPGWSPPGEPTVEQEKFLKGTSTPEGEESIRLWWERRVSEWLRKVDDLADVAAGLRQAKADLENEIERLRHERSVESATLRQELELQRSMTGRLRERLELLSSKLNALRSSSWWKVIAPVRWIDHLGSGSLQIPESLLVGDVLGANVESALLPPADVVVNESNLLTSFLRQESVCVEPPKDLRDLMSCYDESFVIWTYRTLLGREPDPEGMKGYLSRVRAGTPKQQIVCEIASSPEGRHCAVTLPGLEAELRHFRKTRVPIIGLFYKLGGIGRRAQERAEEARVWENKMLTTFQQQHLRLKEMEQSLREIHRKLDREYVPNVVSEGSKSVEGSQADMSVSATTGKAGFTRGVNDAERVYQDLKSAIKAKKLNGGV